MDIDFAISEKVDFIAVSFVKSADVINNLKSYLISRSDSPIEVIAKVESYDSVPNVPEIVKASDAVMVARGDLGESLSICFYKVQQQCSRGHCMSMEDDIIQSKAAITNEHTVILWACMPPAATASQGS